MLSMTNRLLFFLQLIDPHKMALMLSRLLVAPETNIIDAEFFLSLQIASCFYKKFIDQYFALYKKVKVYMEETVAKAKEVGYTQTMMNRKRYMPDLNSQNRQLREAAGRVAINSPVQGSAADLIKLAMIRLAQQISEKKLKSRMILQVHDELVFECPKEEEQEMRTLVKKEMEEVVQLKVPLVVDMGWGKNWNTAHC
ncbi:MAG TPA: hypothetical protein EYQ03_07145 [Nitrospinaceae bacterium]|nr:hypothetical protein [Nitrospinaceae bacterium]